ncbi:MAG: glycosyltransferase family 9 protein [Chthoniobacterales bacterium]
MANPLHILIIKPGSLGDIIHALPAAAWIKKQYPESQLDWLVDTRWRPLLEKHPHIDRLIEFPRTRFQGPLASLRFFPWLKSLGTLRPDLTLDLQGLLRSALMARAAKSIRIVGGDDAREGAGRFYHESVAINSSLHGVERYRSIVQAAGIDTTSPPHFDLPAGTLPTHFKPEPPFVLLHPLSRGKNKSLSKEATQFLIKALAPLRVVLIGRSAEEIFAQDDPDNLINRSTLPELPDLCRAARFIISVDSGPAHLAAAVNPNTLAIHSWSDPRRVGPWEKKAFVWKSGQIFQIAELANVPDEKLHQSAPLPTETELTKIADFIKQSSPQS